MQAFKLSTGSRGTLHIEEREGVIMILLFKVIITNLTQGWLAHRFHLACKLHLIVSGFLEDVHEEF